jgi:hypothetical protein
MARNSQDGASHSHAATVRRPRIFWFARDRLL